MKGAGTWVKILGQDLAIGWRGLGQYKGPGSEKSSGCRDLNRVQRAGLWEEFRMQGSERVQCALNRVQGAGSEKSSRFGYLERAQNVGIWKEFSVQGSEMSLACSDLKRVQGSEKSWVRRDLGKSKCAGFETNTRIKFYHIGYGYVTTSTVQVLSWSSFPIVIYL
jgi:hypothetical protein